MFQITADKPEHRISFIFQDVFSLYHNMPVFNLTKRHGVELIRDNSVSKYGAVIRDCRIIGGSSVILLSNKCILYDYKIHDIENKYLYTDPGFFIIIESIVL